MARQAGHVVGSATLAFVASMVETAAQSTHTGADALAVLEACDGQERIHVVFA